MSDRYIDVLEFVYSRKWLASLLLAVSHLTVILSVLAYGYLVYRHITVSVWALAVFIAATALPFFLVTLLRRLIDAKRPYELSGLFDIPPKDTKGRSFPSRHAYSAFSVAVTLCAVHLSYGIALAVLALLMSVARVILGLHFTRDVLAGGSMGVISGAACIFTLSLL